MQTNNKITINVPPNHHGLCTSSEVTDAIKTKAANPKSASVLNMLNTTLGIFFINQKGRLAYIKIVGKNIPIRLWEAEIFSSTSKVIIVFINKVDISGRFFQGCEIRHFPSLSNQ